MLVSQTRDLVNWLCRAAGLSPLIQIEHTIIEDDDNIKFYRYLHDKKLREESFEVSPDERLIIIVPISSTLTTCLKIENKLRDVLKDDVNKRRKRFKIEQPFYTVVVVGDKFELKKLRRDLNKEIKEYSVVEHYWEEVLDDQIVTYNRERRSLRRNRFSIYIQSGWELPENCQYCFPDNPIQERPLFITDKVSVTPNLVFDAPEWYSLTDSDSENLYFKFQKDDLSLRSNDNPVIDTINRTHYESETTNTHLSYYLNYLDFINANKGKLEQWAKKIKVKIGNEKEVLLIVPDKAENGEFINLINREIFDNKANIIRFDQSSDHYLNFEKFFGKDVNKAGQAIYFVDNSMISGRTFKMIDSTLSHLGRRRIKGIFSLINRVDSSCYNELTECLKENANDIQNHHYSFVNLYLPESTAIPCPQCDERDKYIKLIENASLDCVKQYYIDQELSYLEKVSKEKLIENNQRHKPLEKRHDSTLLKVVLTHFLNKAFADSQPFVEQIDISCLPDWSEDGGHENFFRFNKFVDEFREYIKGHDQCNMDIIKPLKFKANLIKVLTSSPFKKHRGINIAVFYWILNDLIVATKSVLGDGYPFEGKYENVDPATDFTILNAPSKDYDLYIDTVNYLRVLIKYAASLNMAYLLHSDFLAFLSELNLSFNNITSDEMEGDLLIKFKKMRYSLDNFKLFCAAHIVRSLHKNEQRAVRLEKNVNKILQEGSGKGHDTSFEELLVLENTEIIRKTLNATKLKRKYTTGQKKESVSKEEEKEKEVKDRDLPRDYKQFVKNEYHHNRDVLKYTHELKEIFHSKKYKRDHSSIEDEARKIIRLIASIAGYEIDGDMPQGGGVLLYKYQNIGQTNGDSENDGKPKFDSNNYIVIANEGDNVLANLYADMPDHCLASEMLEGKTYLESKEDSESGGFTYTWTNYTAHLDKNNNWVGHKYNGNHEDMMQYDDLNCFDKKNTKRVLFIRISKQGERNRKNSKGDALFVFYDNNDPNGNYNSIHSLRYLYSLRKEINDYFEKRYRNDSFRNWVEERRVYEDILSTEHHHKHQMKKLRDCAIENPDRDKLEFHWRTISDIKPIRDFIKCGKFSIFEDIVDLEIKKQIDFYRRFMLSSHLDNIVNNRIDESLQIRFSEMIFRQIMCEYLDNINQAMHNFTDTLGVGPKVIIDARREEDAIIISIKNNFLMNTEQADKMKSINELGYYVSNSLGGLTTNRKLLMKTGLEKPEVSMKNTDVDGIGEFIIEFKLKNIVHNENN